MIIVTLTQSWCKIHWQRLLSTHIYLVSAAPCEGSSAGCHWLCNVGIVFFTGSLLARKKTQQVWDFLSLTTQLPCSGSHVTKLTNQKPEGLLSFYMYNVIIFLFLFVLFFFVKLEQGNCFKDEHANI